MTDKIQSATDAQPTVLTGAQRDALERMAGHDPNKPGLSYDTLDQLVSSAAQAAKDVLAALAAKPPAAPVETHVNSTVPCYKGGFECNWPACAADCDGRPGVPRSSAGNGALIDALDRVIGHDPKGLTYDTLEQLLSSAANAARELRAALTEVEPQTAVWQSMETAPKDGPAFLVWVPENLCIYEVVARDGNLSIFGGGFRDNLHRATLWQPLPASPVSRPHGA